MSIFGGSIGCRSHYLSERVMPLKEALHLPIGACGILLLSSVTESGRPRAFSFVGKMGLAQHSTPFQQILGRRGESPSAPR